MAQSANQNQLVLDLAATKQALMDRGRCKGSLEQSTGGKVCLDGAVMVGCDLSLGGMYVALQTSARAWAVLRALAAHVPERFKFEEDGPMEHVYFFNDSPATTDQDCFDLIDKALAEAGGLAVER